MATTVSMTNEATRLPTHESAQIKAGPILNFRGQDVDTKVWKVSALIILKSDDNTATLPKVTVSTNPNKSLEAKILGVASKHLFARFDISVPQTESSQQVTYTVDGKEHTFHVPGTDESTRWAMWSCNGYQFEKDRIAIGGIEPMWRRIMEEHDHKPFNLMIGGGDQLYSDGLIDPTSGEYQAPKAGHTNGVFALPSLQEWLAIDDKETRLNHPFTPQMRDEISRFYLEHYCKQFSEPKFKDALATVPSVMVWDDHDIFDGYGSYPEDLQTCPVFKGVFGIATTLYLLVQQQLPLKGKENSHFGDKGYHFLRLVDNGEVAILGVDTRTDRTRKQIVSWPEWDNIFNQLDELPNNCKHLLVLLTVPVIYPSLKALDKAINAIEHTYFIKWLTNQLPGMKNQFRLWELEDDGRDHWGHPDHIIERNVMLERLQDLAKAKGIRVTLLGGDVHIGGAGKLFRRDGKDADSSTMWQVIASPVGNVSPPRLAVSLLSELGGRIQNVGKNNAMQLVPLIKDGTEEGRKLIDKRNYTIFEQDPDNHALHIQLRAEPDPQGENAGKPHRIYRLMIPKIGDSFSIPEPKGWWDWATSWFSTDYTHMVR